MIDIFDSFRYIDLSSKVLTGIFVSPCLPAKPNILSTRHAKLIWHICVSVKSLDLEEKGKNKAERITSLYNLIPALTFDFVQWWTQ